MEERSTGRGRVANRSDPLPDVIDVALSPVAGTNLPTLRSALVSQYGQPTVVNGTDIWNDRKGGNTISYAEIGGVVARIEYKKMGGAGL